MELEGTASEQPAGESMSLGDELSAAFDEHTEPEAGAEVTTEPEVPTEESGNSEAEPTPEEVAEILAAPEHWKAEHRELFDKLSAVEGGDEYQKFLLDRHKEMEGDYTRKTQEVADFKKTWDPVQEMFSPHMENLAAQGLTPHQVVQNWANAERMLTENPLEAIKQLAQTYGADLTQLTGGAEASQDEHTDPEMKALQDELSSLKTQMSQREQAEAQTRHNTFQQQIQNFGEAKTEAGDAAHPHFGEVLDDMVTLAAAERQAGRQPELEALYEKAVWANPGVREKVLAAQQQAAAKKADDEARARATKAKKASASVTGGPGGQSPSSESLSLREQLESQF